MVKFAVTIWLTILFGVCAFATRTACASEPPRNEAARMEQCKYTAYVFKYAADMRDLEIPAKSAFVMLSNGFKEVDPADIKLVVDAVYFDSDFKDWTAIKLYNQIVSDCVKGAPTK